MDVGGFDFGDFGEVVVDEFADGEDFEPGGFIDGGDFELSEERGTGFSLVIFYRASASFKTSMRSSVGWSKL